MRLLLRAGLSIGGGIVLALLVLLGLLLCKGLAGSFIYSGF